MKIEMIKIADLIPYVNNARTHSDDQINQIASSIKEFGFTNPILIDKNNGVIAGHGRILGAKKLGIDELPCVRLENMTEAQKKAYIIADNKMALNAGWDDDLLKIEIESLKELDFDLLLTGFSKDELDDLLKIEEDYDIQEDDFDVEVPEEAKTKPGDIYQLGNNFLMCGDSTKEEDVKKLMMDKQADMVFTDPPWNVNYGAVEEGNDQGYKPRTIMNDFMGTEDFKDFMLNAFKCMNIASKEGAMTYVVMSAQEWGNMMLTLAMNEYHWSSTIIWNKDHLVLSRKDYHTKYEPIWYGWKEGSARLHPLDDRKQSDVWDFDRPTRSDEHPTMKPIELVAQAIKNSSNPGDIVLDLFGGSGTTLIASQQTNRECHMMELDPKYCDVIVNRWESFTNKKAILLVGGNENEIVQ